MRREPMAIVSLNEMRQLAVRQTLGKLGGPGGAKAQASSPLECSTRQ